MTSNTQILLKRQSRGHPQEQDFELRVAPAGRPASGELRCETLCLSLDPYLRGRISGRHLSGAIPEGGLMTGEAVSRVVESKSEHFAPGDLVIAHSGWQSQPVISADAARAVNPDLGPLSTLLGILGMPGLTPPTQG